MCEAATWLQVIDVVDKDAIEVVHLRIDVARHSDVDEEHGPIAPLVQESLPVLAAENRMRRACGADDDVGAARCIIELIECDDLGHHRAGKLLGHAARALGGAIADKDGARTLLHEMPRGDFAHFSRAHQKNSAPLERAKDFARHIDGHGCDGNRI